METQRERRVHDLSLPARQLIGSHPQPFLDVPLVAVSNFPTVLLQRDLEYFMNLPSPTEESCSL